MKSKLKSQKRGYMWSFSEYGTKDYIPQFFESHISGFLSQLSNFSTFSRIFKKISPHLYPENKLHQTMGLLIKLMDPLPFLNSMFELRGHVGSNPNISFSNYSLSVTIYLKCNGYFVYQTFLNSYSTV